MIDDDWTPCRVMCVLFVNQHTDALYIDIFTGLERSFLYAGGKAPALTGSCPSAPLASSQPTRF